MKFHPEAITLLLYFVAGFAVILVIGFVYFGGGQQIIETILDRVDRNWPPTAKPKKNHGRMWRHAKPASYFLLGFLATYLLADYFLLPENYKLSADWRWPVALTVLIVGGLVILVGSQTYEGRRGWAKWTFWGALISTLVVTLWFAHVWGIRGSGSVALVLFAVSIFFIWIFGSLRRIDINEAEIRAAQNSPPNEPVAQNTSAPVDSPLSTHVENSQDRHYRKHRKSR